MFGIYNKQSAVSLKKSNKKLPLQPSNKLTNNPKFQAKKATITKNREIHCYRDTANNNNAEGIVNIQIIQEKEKEKEQEKQELEEECINLVQNMNISDEKDYSDLSADVESFNDLSICEDVNSEYGKSVSQDESLDDSAQQFGIPNFEKLQIPDEWIAHVVNEKDSNLVSVFYSDSEISSSSSDYGVNNDNSEGGASETTELFRKKKLQKTFEDIDKQINLDSFIEGVEKNISTSILQKLAQHELQKQAQIARIIDNIPNSTEKKSFKYFFLDTKIDSSNPVLDDSILSGPDDSIEVDLRKDKLPTVKDLARLYNKALKE